jgi:hypothetical protein
MSHAHGLFSFESDSVLAYGYLSWQETNATEANNVKASICASAAVAASRAAESWALTCEWAGTNVSPPTKLTVTAL